MFNIKKQKGYIQNRTYETPAGEKRYITEILAENVQFLEWGDKQGSGNRNVSEGYDEAPITETLFNPQDNDDVPF